MTADEIRSLIETLAPVYALPVDLVMAQIASESGAPGQIGTGNPDAGPSSEGAIGLMQLLPSTAINELSMSSPLMKAVLRIPSFSARVGMHYMGTLCRKTAASFGMTGLDLFQGMLAVYNAGPGNFMKAVRAFHEANPAVKPADPVVYEKVRPYLPDETRRYVDQIIVTWQAADNPQG